MAQVARRVAAVCRRGRPGGGRGRRRAPGRAGRPGAGSRRRRAVGVDAVAQPAELEHHPRPVDQRLEQVVGDLALGLLGIVERAAVGAGQERERERVRPLAGLADRALGLVDEEQRDQHEQHRDGERAGGLGVAALHERLPDPPDAGDQDRGDHPGLADHVLVQARDRVADRAPARPSARRRRAGRARTPT